MAVDTPIPSDVGNTFYFQTGSGVDAADKLSDKIGAANIGYSASYSSSTLNSALILSASSTGTSANSFTFVSGSTTTTLSGGAASVGATTLAILAPSRGGANGAADLEGSTISGNWASASLVLSGSNYGANSFTSKT